MGSASFGMAFLAGVISILSPCILPLLPVVLGTAVAQHRRGPVALAAGLALSFLIIGLFVATIGFSLGLDAEVPRATAAMLLLAVGVVLMLPALQARLALAAAPLGSWAERRFGGGMNQGLAGQFGVGLLLGAVWTPCVGPTLGAASVLAARGDAISRVALTMLLFAIGTSLPLLLLGLASRQALMRWRGRLAHTGAVGKVAVGLALVAIGGLVLSGFDKTVEAAFLNRMPDWLTDITTRF